MLRLSTVRDTIIKISDAKIEPAVQPEASNEENILSTVKFPIQSVEAVYDHHVCPKCKTVASVIHSDLLLKCNQCNARARCDKVKKTFIVRIIVLVDGQELTITIFDNMVGKFYELKQKSVPTDDEEVGTDFLMEENLNLLYDQNLVCQGFKTE